MWRGAVSFGLVSISVNLYVATESKDVAFHQVHVMDSGRIQNERICSVDGKEVP
jgi:DNA end-binding protein Ku